MHLSHQLHNKETIRSAKCSPSLGYFYLINLWYWIYLPSILNILKVSFEGAVFIF